MIRKKVELDAQESAATGGINLGEGHGTADSTVDIEMPKHDEF